MLPRRCSMSSFCCCLIDSIERTCSIAAASSRGMGRPMTTGEIDVLGSVGSEGLTSVLIGCEIPLIVTRRFLFGEGRVADGVGAGPAGAADGWGSRSGSAGGAVRDVGDGSASCSASSLILTVLGERRPLWGVRDAVRAWRG